MYIKPLKFYILFNLKNKIRENRELPEKTHEKGFPNTHSKAQFSFSTS